MEKFEGFFVNDLRCGVGQYTWSDGSAYSGAWYVNRTITVTLTLTLTLTLSLTLNLTLNLCLTLNLPQT